MSTIQVNKIEPISGATVALMGNQTVSGTLAVTGAFSAPGFNVGNLAINGGMRVAQRPNGTLSTSFVFGAVDRFTVIGSNGSVSAGTIIQNTAATIGSTGKSLKVSNATLTGAGVNLQMRYRMEAEDAALLVNQPMATALSVLHNVGSAINYTIKVNKADAADDFSTVTQIGTSSAQPVNSATETEISFSVADMGDCSNGVEIIVTAFCDEVTSKTFELADFRINKDTTVQPFTEGKFRDELAACRAQYREMGIGITGQVASSSSTEINFGVVFDPPMAKAPTVTLLDTSIQIAGNPGQTSSGSTLGSSPPSILSADGARVQINGFTGLTAGDVAVINQTNAVLAFDAEL